ncbi:hypothetical protein LTR84_009713 [Exophiala bonariae]|uniref:Uncharacterized protein n=1 Tax=Exophiala bonariae TaxID=1690606 RepID=A0AAV9NLL7_9EURO|nr:hypothetical protein LTR84_009713 [Exophiala bonariae]
MPNRDGVYFLDCRRGEQVKTALAYYKNFQNGANDNQFPDDITNVTEAGFGVWETGQTQTVTFGNGTKFNFNIAPDAVSKPDGAVVGTADNGFETFTVFKDRQRVLIITNDGFQCTTIYFAH